MTKVFIPDTNVLLSDPFVTCLLTGQPSHTVILKAVIEELDLLKSNEDGRLARQARAVSRELEQMMRDRPKVEGGWRVREEPASIFSIDEETDRQLRPVDRRSLDDRILACAQIYVQKAAQTGDQVYLITNDRNMRLLAANRGIPTINPAEPVSVALGRYMLPVVSTLYEQKPYTFPLELGEGEPWQLETVPGDLQVHTYHKQALCIRLLAPGDAPETLPPWKFPDPIPVLVIWADADPVAEQTPLYALAKRGSFHPEAREQVLYYREWKMRVILHGNMREEHPNHNFTRYLFERLALEICIERLTPEELEVMAAYYTEQKRKEAERRQQEAERQEKHRLEYQERVRQEKQKQEEQARAEIAWREKNNRRLVQGIAILLLLVILYFASICWCLISAVLAELAPYL